MRAWRLLCYYAVGLLLGAVSVFSYAAGVAATAKPAGTVTAPSTWTANWSPYPMFGSFSEGCDAYRVRVAQSKGACSDSEGAQLCRYEQWGSCYSQQVVNRGCPSGYIWDAQQSACVNTQVVYQCPTGYDGPKTIDGQANMCEEPNPCEAGKQTGTGFRLFPATGTGEAPITCNGQCQEKHVMSLESGASGTFDPYVVTHADGTKSIAAWWTRTLTGQKCTADGPVPAPPPEKPPLPEPKKKPPCSPMEGVLTTQSGAVKCVPEGTPDAPKPNVEKKKKTEEFPDGSTKTTEETKTTDTRSGATHTSTTTTVTAGPTGGTQAGAPGTTGSSADESGTCEGDDCGPCDPTLQMCGDPAYDGLYQKREKTVSGVLGKFGTDMKNTPIGQAFTDVFNVNTPSGGCPNLAAYIPFLNTTIDLAPYICSPTGVQYLEVMGTILKIVVGYIALTWVLF